MTIQQLKYFVAIAEAGTISKAAEELFISQPSLTAAVKKLEEELRISLFKRTNKGVILSHEGTEFLGYARLVLQQLSDIEAKYADQQDVRRDFSVSSQHLHFANIAYINTLKNLGLSKYRFNLIETSTYEVIESVSTLNCDVGVLGFVETNADYLFDIFNRKNLVFHELAVVSGYAFMSVDHPLSKRETVTYEDIYEYPCIIYDQGEHNALYLAESSPKVMNHPKRIHVTDRGTSFQLMKSMNAIATDTGIPIGFNNEFVSVPIDPAEKRYVGYLVNKNMVLNDVASAYIVELEQVVRENCYSL